MPCVLSFFHGFPLKSIPDINGTSINFEGISLLHYPHCLLTFIHQSEIPCSHLKVLNGDESLVVRMPTGAGSLTTRMKLSHLQQ